MNGAEPIRIEYKPAGGNWSSIAFFTRLPGEIVVTPTAPGQPQSGHLRAIFMRSDSEIGSYSPEYPVTVS